MYLQKINLVNFRNYGKQEIAFHPELNIFYGANAQGKTNLLEAIYYLAVTRSFRTSQDAELIKRGEQYFFLRGRFARKKSDSVVQVEIGYRGSQRIQVKLNGVPAKRIEVANLLPVVVFSPEDLLLIKEGPGRRRRFINLEGSRLRKVYYRDLKEYQRALMQRNRLLKENKGLEVKEELFEPWNKVLCNYGSRIIRQRLSLLKSLEREAIPFFQYLTSQKEELSLRYISSFPLPPEDGKMEEHFLKSLQGRYGEERRRGYTLVGPHLDDFEILINGAEAQKYASQGQQRSAVLALKMAEVKLFNAYYGESPLVLLDDVFSELDGERKRHLLQHLEQMEAQVFITGVELPRYFKGETKIFQVNEGMISNEGNWGDH